MADEERTVRLVCSGGSEGILELRGLTPKEITKMEGVLSGCDWVSADGGRLRFSPRCKPLPEPVDDEEMIASWPVTGRLGNERIVQLEFWTSEELGILSYPSITINYLCGYSHSPEKYKWQAETLESFGFECLRSRRGEDGKFSEAWVLSSLIFAKGELKEYLDECPEGEVLIDRATSFLSHCVSFGTLDVSVKRMIQALG
jgi:hypothetical protein